MSKISYGMTKEYRKEWGIIDAVREIVQNCIDNKHCKHTFKYNSLTEIICIQTENFVLPKSTFALGESQNKTSDSIGGFGEGFKLALLVLERENCSPRIYFGGTIAVPEFEHDSIVERDIFTVTLEETPVTSPNTSFVFDFPLELVEELKSKITVFDDNPLEQNVTTVELLPKRPGQIFVNGLFVCEVEKFKYGYNFPARLIELGCDRQIANPLGLAWETSKYWATECKEDPQEVLQMMTYHQLDVQDIHWHTDKQAAINITDAFIERYGAVTIKPMSSTLSHGMRVHNSLYNTLRMSGKIEVANKHEESGTPYRTLVDFLETNKKHMRRCSKKNLQELIEKSKSWRK